MTRIIVLLFALGLSSLTGPLSRADVTLAPLFRDGAVLQRDQVVPVWGRGAPGERVSVTFAGQEVNGLVREDGRWRLDLSPLAVASTGGELVVRANNEIRVRDVLVGDVWMCSGQSNMNARVANVANAAAEQEAGNFSLIRQFRIPTSVADAPQESVEGSWVAASPETVVTFTAVGYYFARDIHREIGVPVGLVHNSYGGTRIEAWMRTETLRDDPVFADVLAQWAEGLARYPDRKTHYDGRMAEWKPLDAAARAEGKEALRAFQAANPRPNLFWIHPGSKGTPGGLFNAMIHPVIPYAMKGILWYQGESNTRRPATYHHAFTTMIQDWRHQFQQPELPFLWVQLANFEDEKDLSGVGWAIVRDAQTQALELPHTGMAVTIDIGEADDIHPKNKQDVGHRLARVAEATVYGRDVAYRGPTFAGMEHDGAKMRVTFGHADEGLIAKHAQEVKGFQIAGADRKFVTARATLDGDSVVVWSADISEPVAVRYAWSNCPETNLYNGDNLPAVPFRTDSW